jgi:hypothetical protein
MEENGAFPPIAELAARHCAGSSECPLVLLSLESAPTSRLLAVTEESTASTTREARLADVDASLLRTLDPGGTGGEVGVGW